MSIIEKIKKSIEEGVKVPFYYYTEGELNEVFDNVDFPCAYAVPVSNGAVSDVNGRFHDRPTIYVYFADLVCDDDMGEPMRIERKIDHCKRLAFGWLTQLRRDDDIRLISVNGTAREYNRFDVITCGFGVNVTLEEVDGFGICDLK